ncbi:MAG: hypothetical protein IJI35_08140, partial [Kiritimatiellae bacterium]|nr:hypothetical protein [Kiritimatiellia bacterium]
MKLTNRLMGFTTAIIMCAACAVMLVPGLTPAPSQALADEPEQYPLYIQGIQVTSDNASDIMGDGTISYDADTGTLTLDCFNVTGQPAAGPGSVMPTIKCTEGDLIVNLKGDNAIVGGSKGEVDAFYVSQNLTFTGDGNLYAGGGYVPMGLSSGSGFHAIQCKKDVTFDEDFSGVAVIQGPDVGNNGSANDNSRAIMCWEGFSIKGGTVILTGGTTVHGMSEGMHCQSASVEGGVLVAQGGIEQSGYTAYGIGSTYSVSVTGGALIARGGVMLENDGEFVNSTEAHIHSNRKAIGILDGNLVVGEGMSVLGEVGYVNNVFTSDAEALDSEGVVTGIVVASNGFTEVDELPTALTGDVYHITTDGTIFTTDVDSLDTAGHTALFVNLFESADTETFDSLIGARFTSNGVSFAGEGEVVSVGGLLYNTDDGDSGPLVRTFGYSYGFTGGIISLNGGEAVEGPTVVGVGGPCGKESIGCIAKTLDMQGGNFVAVGGSTGPGRGNGASCGILQDPTSQNRDLLSTHGTAKALVVGGTSGDVSSGLSGADIRSFDTSAIAAVGGTAVAGNSFGTEQNETANGGTVACIGGYSSVLTSGCNGFLVSCRGGKAVALGGGDGSGTSYGSWTNEPPALSYGGSIVAAGRTHALEFTLEGHEEDNFFPCGEGVTGNAWMDYDGTLGQTQVDYHSKLDDIYNFKRIVIDGRPMRSVTFDANGGTGEMETMLLRNGGTRIILPENGFGEPDFKRFDAWLCKNGNDDPGERLDPGNPFNVAGQATVIAQWSDSKWTRVAGDTRYDTMAAISREAFPGTSEWAVVASG